MSFTNTKLSFSLSLLLYNYCWEYVFRMVVCRKVFSNLCAVTVAVAHMRWKNLVLLTISVLFIISHYLTFIPVCHLQVKLVNPVTLLHMNIQLIIHGKWKFSFFFLEMLFKPIYFLYGTNVIYFNLISLLYWINIFLAHSTRIDLQFLAIY